MKAAPGASSSTSSNIFRCRSAGTRLRTSTTLALEPSVALVIYRLLRSHGWRQRAGDSDQGRQPHEVISIAAPGVQVYPRDRCPKCSLSKDTLSIYLL